MNDRSPCRTRHAQPPPIEHPCDGGVGESRSSACGSDPHRGPGPLPQVRVAIVDDHAPVRQSLREYLQGCPGLQVVAEGRNGSEAAAIAVQAEPDVLLMDLSMPGQNGMDALEAIRARAPGVGVLILSGYPQELYGPQMLQRGAAGFLHKNCAPEQILRAIHAVAAGQRCVPPELARVLERPPAAAGEGAMQTVPRQEGAWADGLRQSEAAAA